MGKYANRAGCTQRERIDKNVLLEDDSSDLLLAAQVFIVGLRNNHVAVTSSPLEQ